MTVDERGQSPDDSGSSDGGDDDEDIRELLERASKSEVEARNKLITILYSELKRIARRQRSGQSAHNTLQTTALVHEAYAKLFHDGAPTANGRDHFFALAARAMRHLLVDHQRSKKTDKRMARGEREPLDALATYYERNAIDLIAWNDALGRLERDDPTMARAIELRFILQLDEKVISKIVGLPIRTLQRYWEPTLRRLRREME